MRTTEKHFELFKKWCNHYIKIWQITDWDTEYGWKQSSDAYAWIERNAVQRVATIYFTKSWDKKGLKPLNEESIRECTKHEVAHLLTGTLEEMAGARYVTKDELVQSIETLIQNLVRLLPEEL